MTDAFDRYVQLTVGPSELVGRSWRTWQFGALGPTRIKFDVRLTSNRRPNKALVELFNLSRSSLDFISLPGQFAVLKAGYREATAVLLSGDIRSVDGSRNGRTHVTTIKIGDGEINFLVSRFDQSYAGRVSNLEVITDIVTAFGLGLSFLDPELPPRVYEPGLVFFGSARDALDKVVGDVGAEWSIQDGAIQVFSGNAKSNGVRVVVLELGGTLVSAESKKGGAEIVSKLDGSIWPGRGLRMVGKNVSGDFVARTVEHVGDGFDAGSPYNTRVKARRIRRP